MSGAPPPAGASAAPAIGPGELKARLDGGEEPCLVDIREPWEWRLYNLGDYGARHIPMGELLDRLDELDPDREIVLYCRTGGRSGNVQRYLECLGYSRVCHLDGGLMAWGDAIDPAVPRY